MRAFLAPQLFNNRAEMLAPVLAACLGIGGSTVWQRVSAAKADPCSVSARTGQRICAPAASARMSPDARLARATPAPVSPTTAR